MYDLPEEAGKSRRTPERNNKKRGSNGKRNHNVGKKNRNTEKKHRFRKILLTCILLFALILGGMYYIVGNVYAKLIYMTSLLRDMYVEIPGYKNNRLNAAYSFGGAEQLLEIVEQNLGIEVNRYVQVNFEAFANLVDAVGGVELDFEANKQYLRDVVYVVELTTKEDN